MNNKLSRYTIIEIEIDDYGSINIILNSAVGVDAELRRGQLRHLGLYVPN